MSTLFCTPRTGAALLVLALLGTPCLAVTSASPGAAHATLLQGVIEQSGSALRINGKNYALSSATTVIHDRSGARVSAAQLVAGKTVAFSIANEGSQARIKELWLID
jgi:hypothetical protein